MTNTLCGQKARSRRGENRPQFTHLLLSRGSIRAALGDIHTYHADFVSTRDIFPQGSHVPFRHQQSTSPPRTSKPRYTPHFNSGRTTDRVNDLLGAALGRAQMRLVDADSVT
jgi:hypothetical protein